MLKNTKARKVRLTQVAAINKLSHHLQRIVLEGPDLADFPTDQDGAHVKVLLPCPGDTMPNLDIHATTNAAVKRSYTIRSFNADKKQLVIDFVINRHKGPATDWAKQAKVGDYLGIAGPGALKLTHFDADNYLLIGDITSVNAVNGYIKHITPTATIKALITVPSRDDIIPMDGGDNVEIHWRVEDENPSDIADSVQQIAQEMPKDTPVFIGLEARQLRSVKSTLLDTVEFDRQNIYATGYWKKGMDADRFSRDKKRNAL